MRKEVDGQFLTFLVLFVNLYKPGWKIKITTFIPGFYNLFKGYSVLVHRLNLNRNMFVKKFESMYRRLYIYYGCKWENGT